PAPQAVACKTGRVDPAAVVARRTDHRTRRRWPGAVRRTARCASGARRHCRGCHAPDAARKRCPDGPVPGGLRRRCACADCRMSKVRPAPLHGLASALAWTCRRDLRLAAQSRAELAVILLFFLLVASLFPLAVS